MERSVRNVWKSTLILMAFAITACNGKTISQNKTGDTLSVNKPETQSINTANTADSQSVIGRSEAWQDSVWEKSTNHVSTDISMADKQPVKPAKTENPIVVKGVTSQDTLKQGTIQPVPKPVQKNQKTKWTVDKNTKEGIEHLKSAVSVFAQAYPQPGLMDYHELGNVMESIIQKIRERCTMTGQAYDALNKYLKQFRPLTHDLQSSKKATAKKAYDQLSYLLVQFNQKFQ